MQYSHHNDLDKLTELENYFRRRLKDKDCEANVRQDEDREFYRQVLSLSTRFVPDKAHGKFLQEISASTLKGDTAEFLSSQAKLQPEALTGPIQGQIVAEPLHRYPYIPPQQELLLTRFEIECILQVLQMISEIIESQQVPACNTIAERYA